MHCNQQLMDSWCKVVEIMVGVVNEDQEKEGTKISVFFEIIQDLLLKVNAKLIRLYTCTYTCICI